MPPTQIVKALKAAKEMDWLQVVSNGGPPCFHIQFFHNETGQEEYRFCGRAQRWAGHTGNVIHAYVSLYDLLVQLIEYLGDQREENENAQ